MAEGIRDRELVLPQMTFSFVLDRTKGGVGVWTGPTKVTLSENDRTVLWDSRVGKFIEEDDLERAKQTFVRAEEGQYIVLNNPASEGQHEHPHPGSNSAAVELDAGRKMIIPGPASFALWPGQTPQVVDGHHMKSNQYLVARVYEEEQARRHAESAVVALQGGQGDDEENTPERGSEAPGTLPEVEALTMGKQFVIKGTDVSWYIPSTGIEVVPDDDGNYVREAATLERLEYCILLDQDGEKRYVRGPDVVFPEPTEEFITDQEGNFKFRAIELNEHSGLHIKVIAGYENETGTYAAGEELFVTGRDTPIYFPGPEHSIIQIAGQKKHHAIAIPKGDGRYVLDRRTGEVLLVKGPKMFLPDPRHQTVVRRVLDPRTVDVMYPGNQEALKVNEEFEKERVEQSRRARKAGVQAAEEQFLASSYASTASVMDPQTEALRGGVSSHFGGETVERSGTQRKPRTITLDDKYEGAVRVRPFSGYSVLVINRTGDRRVEQGPKAVLLEYDEDLEQLTLSTGKPKNDNQPRRTVYLRTINNQVSDQVVVETQDLVQVTLNLSYRVNFEGEDPLKWFDVENYVQLLCDHCRSRLRNEAKRHTIDDFYTHSINIIRDSLLGEIAEGGGRRGLPFEENNMRLYDVEVTDAVINDAAIGQLLVQTMGDSFARAIRVRQAEDEAEAEGRLEELKRDKIHEHEITRRAEAETVMAELDRSLQQQLKDAENDFKVAEVSKQERDLALAMARTEYEQNMELESKLDEVQMARLSRETEQFVKRVTALQGGVIEALQAFGDKVFVEQLVESIGPAALAMGISTADIFAQVFKGTPFEGITTTLTERPLASGNGEAVGITRRED